jgi:hypothetical protein
MPSQLERKELLGPLARQAAELGDGRSLTRAPVASEHPLAQLGPGIRPRLPEPAPDRDGEDADTKADRARDLESALLRVSAAYADGRGAEQAVSMLQLRRAEAAEKRARKPATAAGSGELASFGQGQAPGQEAEPDARQQAYTALYPSLYCTGITNTQEDARDAAGELLGFADDDHALAAYGAGGPTGMAADARTVTHYADLGNLVTVDESGQVVLDEERLGQRVSTFGVAGIGAISYPSPLELGQSGADSLERQMAQNGQPPDHDQFVSVQAHSGGGQSAFFTLVELHRRGYTNLSLVGYEMALTPHEREVLEQLGVQVTNLSGHDRGNVSDVGGTIRRTMGGGDAYYDMYMDRTGEGGAFNTSQHSLIPDSGTSEQTAQNMERVQVMMQFSTWLDSQGLHQQWTEENYAAFLRATGYSPSISPLSSYNLYRGEDGTLQYPPCTIQAPPLPS